MPWESAPSTKMMLTACTSALRSHGLCLAWGCPTTALQHRPWWRWAVACLQWDSCYLYSKTSPRPGERETSSPGTRTLKDLSAPAGLCLPAPADCSHNQSRDPSHCAHHDQPCGGDTGVSRSCAAPTQHCPEQCRTSVATASLCFPGEGVRPPTSVLQALPSTTSSFEGMGDASTGYFVAAVLVEVERVAAALLPAGPLRRSSSLNLLGTRCLPVVAGVAMGQSWV